MNYAPPTAADFDPLIALYNSRRYPELENQTRSMLAKHPNAAFAWQLLGGALQMQGKDALIAFQKTAELSPNDASAHFNLGVALKSAGRLEQAASSYRRALALKPQYVEALSNLGNVLQGLSQFDEAVKCYQQALALQPRSENMLYSLGNAQRGLKQLEQAVQAYQQAINLNPNFIEALSNLAATLYELGHTDAALLHYQKALKTNPYSADLQLNLGRILSKLNSLDQTIAELSSGNPEHCIAIETKARQIITQFPELAVASQLLGVCLHQQERYQEALSALLNAVRFLPSNAEMHYHLAAIQVSLGKLKEAEGSYRLALTLKPDFAEAYNNLADVMLKLEQPNEALICCRHALQIRPNYVGAIYNLGNALVKLEQRNNAIEHFQRAIELQPDFSAAHFNLGCNYSFLGQISKAQACYRKVLEIKPEQFDAHTSLLFSLNYVSHSPEEYLVEALRFGKIAANKATSRYVTWQCATQPQKLRAGIVSGDLRDHVVCYFLENLFPQFDYSHIEFIAYNTQSKEDELTARIKPYFAHWRSLVGLSDQAAAHLIHSDAVHVLLDLSGHTNHNRLPVFAWKPAPVQCTWLGYFASTGLKEMDYILSDQWMLPDSEAHHFVEKGWRMHGALCCFTPPKEGGEVLELPALRNHSIMFGSLNRIDKINNQVMACWARILKEIPGSQLYLNTHALLDEGFKRTLIGRFAAHEITEDRLVIEATSGRELALKSYARIDIALDTFPYPGGTTSYEALWMGVPILTMTGKSYISHLGESIMHHAGLPDWIATSEDDYVAKAVRFTRDLPKLAALRAGLREQVRTSPLFNAPLFAKHFEDALWGMWENKGMQTINEMTRHD